MQARRAGDDLKNCNTSAVWRTRGRSALPYHGRLARADGGV